MKATELLAYWRTGVVHDVGNPSLWSDAEFYTWINDAEVEACRRARLLVDTQTTAICRVQLVNLTEQHALDRRIIYVRRALMAGRNLPLEPLDYRDLDVQQPGWQSKTGQVTSYVRNLDTGKFRPYRIPTTASLANGSTVDLTVVREPLTPMTAADSQCQPEINARYHLNLLDWVSHRAYSKQDAEAKDDAKAAAYLTKFEAEFGTRQKASAFEEEWQRLTLPDNELDGTY